MSYVFFRQGEKWYHLRKHLTGELTSPSTMQGFLPELNSICDDFLVLLDYCRKSDGTVVGFDQLTNRMGLECKYTYIYSNDSYNIDCLCGAMVAAHAT